MDLVTEFSGFNDKTIVIWWRIELKSAIFSATFGILFTNYVKKRVNINSLKKGKK